MSSSVTPQLITSSDEFEQSVDLRRIWFYEVSGRRHEAGLEGEAEVPDGVKFKMQVLHQITDNRLVVRARTHVNTPDGEYDVDVAASFEAERPLEATDEVVKTFSEQHAVPALYPYIRTEIHRLSMVLGIGQPILGLLRKDARIVDTPPAD